MKHIRRLVSRETGLYLLFGVLTTVVNYGVFWLAYGPLGLRATVANTLAFVVAVAFAFVVNKRFVFGSPSWAFSVLRREIPGFLAGRIFSFLLEQLGLFLAEDVWALGRWSVLGLDGILLAKAALAVIVVAVNYIFGKLVFRKK